MAYNFEDRLNRLPSRMRELNSRPVQYWRGGSILFEALATVYELRTDELIAFGVTNDARRLDFLFTMKDVPIGFMPVDDTDMIYDPALDLQCKVSPLGEEAESRWFSHTRVAMRIHTHAATYSLPASATDLSAVVSQSLVGSVMVATENVPLATIMTDSVMGAVVVEADLDPVFTGSVVGELESDEHADAVPI